jgi:hypothetical protein
MTERGSVRVARGRGGRGRGGQASPSKSRTDRSLNSAAGFRPAECQPGQNVVVALEGGRRALARVMAAWDGAFFHVTFQAHGGEDSDQVRPPPARRAPAARAVTAAARRW